MLQLLKSVSQKEKLNYHFRSKFPKCSVLLALHLDVQSRLLVLGGLLLNSKQILEMEKEGKLSLQV